MAKSIVLCSDGTGNAFVERATNVSMLIRSIDLRREPKAERDQVAYYDQGVGTNPGLVTDAKAANRAELLAWAQNHGVPELSIPKKIVLVEQVPILGTGKTDYPSVAKVANERLAIGEAKAAE